MIVRDNETTIGPALESIRPWVDRIIVVDTGSKDKTPEICREFGAEVHEFPWCDDFSAARNESLKYAAGEWIFWMDSDDTISAECGRKLRELAYAAHPDRVLGYVIQVHCPGPEEDGQFDVTAVDHVKLFRNRPDLRFEGRIHEQLLPAIRRAGGEVAWTDIFVRHSGSDHSPEGFRRKLDRDLRILHRELEECPNHPFVLFNLGMTYADAARASVGVPPLGGVAWASAHAPVASRGASCEGITENVERGTAEPPEGGTRTLSAATAADLAIAFLERCLAVSTPDESHLRKAFSLLVSSLCHAELHDEAWLRCQRGLGLFPTDKELLFRCAMLHHHFGRLAEAEQTYLRVLNDREERHFTSIDLGLGGYKARHNLAIVYGDMGRYDKAEEQWRLVVQEVPEYRAGWLGLGDALIKTDRLHEAAALAEELRPRKSLGATGRLLESRLCERTSDFEGARRALECALREAPRELAPLRELCRLLFEHFPPADAVQALRQLSERDPGDAAAHHNLGAAYCRLGLFDRAAEAYRRSLELRPDCPLTIRHLESAIAESRAALYGAAT
jgi:tetratricopeptide (TPR) repeat protein